MRSLHPLPYDNLFEDFFPPRHHHPEHHHHRGGLFAVDVHESEQGFRVQAELPGLSHKDVEVHIEGRVLTLRAQRPPERLHLNHTLLHSERYRGSWQRQLALGYVLDHRRAEANLSHGVLRVYVPKAQIHRGGYVIAVSE